MEIGLTEAVRKMASAGTLPAPQEDELLFCWDLSRVDFGQRKLLVASNVATRLCAIARMTAADWRHIDEAALRLVEDAVGSAGLDARAYLELAGEARLSRTHGTRSPWRARRTSMAVAHAARAIGCWPASTAW